MSANHGRMHSARPTATILVADDEISIRGLIASVLRSRGHYVLEAASGTEALHAAADHAGLIHLLVTDVIMPALDGRELCLLIRSERPETKLLVISGYLDLELPPDLPFLANPFRISDLLFAVENLLA